ncbi:MAG: hypothetical protein II984_05970 [Clostridia bacterium]|nr:hypothetical protein [Clostridia bacterium]
MKKAILIFFVLCLLFTASCRISIDKGYSDTDKGALTDLGSNTGKDTGSDDVIIDTESDTTTDTDKTNTDTDTDITTDTDIIADAEKIYVITVKDQDGLFVSDATVSIYDNLGDIIKTLTTNNEGKAVCSLKGKFFVDVYSLPDGYTDSMPHTELIENTVITVNNNNPNGTQKRPYSLSDGLTTVEINANEKIFYTVSFGDNKTFRIKNATGIKVTYGNNSYTPNGKNEINFIMDKNEQTSLIVENTSYDRVSVTAEVFYQRTEMEKAESIRLHTDVEALASAGKAKYFKWIADRSGMVMVYSQTENNNIRLYNKTLNMWSQETNGNMCEYMYANENDEIYVEVSAVSYDEISIVFAIYSYNATIMDDPIPLMNSTTVALLGNQRFYFIINKQESNIRIEGKGKLYCNGAEYDISLLDSLKLESQQSGMPIFFEIENTEDTAESYKITFE